MTVQSVNQNPINFKRISDTNDNVIQFNNGYKTSQMPPNAYQDDMFIAQTMAMRNAEKKEQSRDRWNKANVIFSGMIGVGILGSLIAMIASKGHTHINMGSKGGFKDPTKFNAEKLLFEDLSKDDGIADIKTTKTLSKNVQEFFVDLLDSTKYEEKYIKRAGLMKDGFPNAFLLLGGPGTGKTETVRMYAKASGGELATIKLGDFANSYVDGTATSMLDMFKYIKEKAEKEPNKTITVLFDEVDALARKIEKIDGHNEYLGKNRQSFLTGIDMIKPLKNVRVFATTNIPLKEIDPAVVRRLSRNTKFEIPEIEASFEALKFHMRDCEGCKSGSFDFFKDKESEIKSFLKKVKERKGAFGDITEISKDARSRFLKAMQNAKDDTKLFEVKYLTEALENKGKMANELTKDSGNEGKSWSDLNPWQRIKLFLFGK